MLKELWLKQSDGQDVFLKKWMHDKSEPRAIIQIAHGLAEHSGRYQAFASFLLSHDYFVYANDHRGHGRTGENMGPMGYYADTNGFERAVEDLKSINDQIHHDYPDVPVFMLGHSMGSFLTRRFIQQYSGLVNGAIISGTGAGKGLIGKIGRLIAKWEIKKHGAKAESPLLDKLSFGRFNKGLTGPGNWLSRDPESVRAYQDDAYCGFISTSGLYYDLLSGIEQIHKSSEIRKTEKNLPLLFISGAEDPVGKKGKGVKRVVDSYRKAGSKMLDLKLYPNARHEMLFELNREEVMTDILTWLDEQAKKR